METIDLAMFDWLATRAETSPKKIALIFGVRVWNYGELNTLVSQMAGQLATAGVQKGQRVAALMPNQVEYVLLIHALTRLGVVLVPLNVRLTGDELRRLVESANCSLVICSQETQAKAARLGEAWRRVVSVDLPRDSPSRQSPGVEALAAFPVGDPTRWIGDILNMDAVQAIVFTSGTTGHSKGAMLTYTNHFWSATGSAYRLGTRPEDRWLLCMPLYHVGGMAVVLRCCLYGTTVVLQNGFDPTAVSEALDTQDITLVSVVPTMLHRLLETRGDRPIPEHVRCILLGGAAAPLSLLEKCRALNLPVATTYGLTEAASQVATATPTDVSRKPGTVGKPLMFVDIGVVDGQGQDLSPGEMGEIVLRGPTVMDRYINQPQESGESVLHTGDMGYLDKDGDLWVVQRRMDLIVSGGENVVPEEVERVLLQHPDVRETRVVGVEDAEWGQRVVAAVVPLNGTNPTLESLTAFCREHLAGHKIPRRFQFVDSLPRTASGKVRREAVKAFFY